MKSTTPFTVPVYPPSTPAKGIVSSILITGNTYPVREQIKAMGGRWVRKAQGWEVPVAVAAAAQALVDAAPAAARRPASRYQSHYAYFPSTGGEWYQNKNGRCEDAPCCGCCN